MGKGIILAILILFLVPTIVAEVELTFPFNSEFDLKRPCFNNGTFCSSSATCNITITHPDGSLLVDAEGMQNKGTYHNITVLAPSNNQLGIHPVSMVCDDNNLLGDDTFEIEITGDGFSFRTFPLQFVGIIFAVGFIIVGAAKDELRMFKRVGGLLAMVMGVLTLYPGFANVNYSNLMGMGIGFSTIGLGFFFLVQDSFSFERQVETFQQDDDGRFHGND